MAERREEIIQAGIEIFAAKGYYNTHIADIVKSVGIAKGTFYLYFKSKKSLFITLIKRFEKLFSNIFTFADFEKNNKNLKLLFYEMLRKIFKLYKTHQNLSIIILREAVAVNPEFEDRFKKMDKNRFQRLKELYNFLIEKKLINSEMGFEYFACTFIGIMESIVLRRLLLNSEEFNYEEAADKISGYLVKALSK